jgi:hypothetical protein
MFTVKLQDIRIIVTIDVVRWIIDDDERTSPHLKWIEFIGAIIPE